MTDKLNDDQKRHFEQVPAGRMGEADEIAAAVLYLASAEAGYVTGTTLREWRHGDDLTSLYFSDDRSGGVHAPPVFV